MSKIYNVLTANPKGHIKNLTVKGGDGVSVAMCLHRFAVVGKGDRIRFGAAGSNKVFVVAKDVAEPAIPLTPLFSTTDTVSIGKEKFRINIREINSEAAMRGLEFLEQFHYKTNNSLAERSPAAESKSSTAAVGGRRAVLYANIQIGARWLPAAYIDLQMPLMMCKPRHDLFDNPFRHPKRSIHWESWDQHAMRDYLNAIVRIGRIVVSPEF